MWLHWANVFVQDEYRATEHLRLTAGAKVETNAYRGSESTRWSICALAWHCLPGLEMSLLGQDLGRRHVEFDPSNSSRLGPRAFIKVVWSMP